MEARSWGLEYEYRSNPDGTLTIEGYAAVFDQPAPIVDWRGRYTETLHRGAFAKSVSERRPHLLVEHGRHPLFGNVPVGALRKAGEDDHGLHIRGSMFRNWLTQPYIDAVQGGAVRGMSIEMIVLQDEWTDSRSRRAVREAMVPEVSIVLDPAYTGTELSIRSLRSLGAFVAADADLRSAMEAALGTSTATPEPAPVHSVPTATLEAYRRLYARRLAG
jgi:HK97 family phage prohead protease